MTYLIFDTETTGLPINWKAPVSDLNNWPRLVQIAWMQCDNSGKILSSSDYIVKPRKSGHGNEYRHDMFRIEFLKKDINLLTKNLIYINIIL
jgi:DNA polymerase III epsilon subunit-like protein